MIRGIGPSLPIAGALRDPFLELHDSSGLTIAANDNWHDSSHLQEIIAVKDRHIAEQDRHTAELQAALDRILYSAPGRLYRRARAILSLGRR